MPVHDGITQLEMDPAVQTPRVHSFHPAVWFPSWNSGDSWTWTGSKHLTVDDVNVSLQQSSFLQRDCWIAVVEQSVAMPKCIYDDFVVVIVYQRCCFTANCCELWRRNKVVLECLQLWLAKVVTVTRDPVSHSLRSTCINLPMQSRVLHFLLRAASFGNHRFLSSDARHISKLFAVGMTSVTQCN